MNHLRIYCMFNSGKPLTPHMAEVLFVNAYAMWSEKIKRQEIRSRRYQGFISTNLLVINYLGTPCVEFLSIVTETQEQWGVNQVKFIVRVDDLSVPPDVAFGQIQQLEGPPIPLPMDLFSEEESEWDVGEATGGYGD